MPEAQTDAVTVTVAWQMPDPPVEPTRWHNWDATTAPSPIAPSPTDATDATTESTLAWPPGTVALLRQAFTLGLPRTTGWDAAPPLAAAARAAARAFRRGVGFRIRGSEPSPAPTPTLAGRYDISIQSTPPLAAALATARAATTTGTVFCVLDANVARLWPDARAAAPDAHLVALDEHSKTLASAAAITAAWRAAGSAPHWVIVGGGLLTDVAAYAAHLAGAATTFVPTTLLAMADACVGGKTGVNFPPFGKNQLGAFHFPVAVHAWAGWLATLPPRELAAGGVECLKHAFLAGDEALAESLAEALARRDAAALTPLLRDVIAVKADVVRADPTETGERATLNFGHTLGHALEALSQSRTRGDATILHGEAVGVGMAFALRLSQRVAGLSRGLADQMIDQIRAAHGLPSAADLAARLGASSLADPDLFAALAPYIALDKKNAAAGAAALAAQWILLERPGKVARGEGGAWTVALPLRDVEAVWRDFAASL